MSREPFDFADDPPPPPPVAHHRQRPPAPPDQARPVLGVALGVLVGLLIFAHIVGFLAYLVWSYRQADRQRRTDPYGLLSR